MTPLFLLWFLSAVPSSNLLQQAASALERNDYSAAIESYRSYLAYDPQSYEARYGLARALSFSGQWEQAISVYTDILADHPGDPDVFLGRGRAYAWNKNYEQAQQDLFFVTAHFPHYGDAWSALGDVYLWSNQAPAAADAYGKWIELAPNDPAPYLARAKANLNAQRFEAVNADLQTAREKGAKESDIEPLLPPKSEPIPPSKLESILPSEPSPQKFLWEASLFYSYNALSSGLPGWHRYGASVKRKFSNGVLGIEGFQAQRFSEIDEGAAIDGYLDLWREAYGNLRLQIVPGADFMPQTDALLELYQDVGGGWEISGNYRLMDYSNDDINIYGFSIGKYLDDWYIRGRLNFTPKRDNVFVSGALSLRRYFGEDNFLELGGGLGEEIVTLGAGPLIEGRKTKSISLKGQKYFLPHWGVALIYEFYEIDRAWNYHSVSVEILTRW
ncbi:MAG: YaiO family outer membrane beta-barrel protein [Candidatus Omnitrophota bacterium]